MNTPNPLVPKGSLLEQQKSKGKSNLFIAVFTILAIHVILFAGLLMQGCRPAKPESQSLESALTNTVPAEPVVSTNPAVPVPSTNDYYAVAPTSAPPVNPGALMAPLTNTGAAASIGIADTTALGGEAKSYKVAPNDSFYKIAKAQGISISALAQANPGVDSRKLKVGQTLQVPAPVAKTEVAAASASATGTATEAAVKPAASKTYIVKAGDTMTKVAKAHGVKVKTLRDANKLKSDRLVVGQKLKIPAHKTDAAAAPAAAAPAAAPVESATAPMPLAPAPLAPLTNRM